MLNRAFSLLEIKQVDEDARVITGIATTPTPDRLEDVIEPEGVTFNLPLPLLWQHDSKQPIGHVTHAKVTKAGIDIIAKIFDVPELGRLKDRLDEAWQSMKYKLVSGLSIGFKPIEVARIEKTRGMHFLKWDWLELSAVTVPANAEATITTIRSIDTAQRAALGRKPISLEQTPAGASASRQRAVSPEGNMQRTLAEQISAFEGQRATKSARMEEIQAAAITENRSKNEVERDEFDTLSRDIETIDEEMKDLRRMESIKAASAVAVKAVVTQAESAVQRSGSIIVKTPPKLPPGIGYAQMVRCILLSQRQFRPPDVIAAELHGPDSIVVGEFMRQKAAVPAGATVAGNWLSPLVGDETGAVADFVGFLHKQTILGKFGTNGVPALRSVMFRVPLISQIGAGDGFWVGEGRAKPVTSFAFERTTLEPLKVANICGVTEESIRYSSPKADAIIRDSLANALRKRLDTDFINPAKTAVAGVSPASITNGADTIASSGEAADDIRLDIRSLFAAYSSAENPMDTGVWIMSNNTAAALAMLNNPLGQPEFPTMVTGRMLFSMPVIVTNYVTDIVVLMNAEDVYLADEGEIAVASSSEASVEMSDAPTGSGITPTGASLVSAFQNNLVFIRAERTINWMRRPNRIGVVYLTGVAWGGEVNTA
jgi:HK97 family phage prohead protease